MEFKIGTISKSGDEFSFGELISHSEFSALKKALTDLSIFRSNLDLLEIVNRNYTALRDFIQNTRELIITKQSFRWNGVGRNEQQNLVLESNRLLLNYLSSVRTFLDHSETLLKRQFGNPSAEFLDFNQVKQRVHRDSFGYRFFYELRNYAQHCGLPLEVSHTSNVRDPRLPADTAVHVFFNKKKLLSDFDWKKILKDLEKQPDGIEFDPLFIEANGHINLLSQTLKTILGNRLRESANYLNNRMIPLLNQHVNVCLFSNFKKGAKRKLTFVSDQIPAELVREILQTTLPPDKGT